MSAGLEAEARKPEVRRKHSARHIPRVKIGSGGRQPNAEAGTEQSMCTEDGEDEREESLLPSPSSPAANGDHRKLARHLLSPRYISRHIWNLISAHNFY
jgi:hypothetical protein